jgi:hypothetical protein
MFVAGLAAETRDSGLGSDQICGDPLQEASEYFKVPHCFQEGGSEVEFEG